MTKQGIRDLNYRGPRRSSETAEPAPLAQPDGAATPMPGEGGPVPLAEGATPTATDGGSP